MGAINNKKYKLKKPYVGVCEGVYLGNSIAPRPNANTTTVRLGVVTRVLRATRNVNLFMIPMLLSFVQKFCEEFLVPLAPETSVDVEDWLKTTNYNERRKEQLRQADYNVGESLAFYGKHRGKDLRYKVKGHMKNESYTAFKAARGIYARSDYSKLLFGPYAKAIEHEVFRLPWFVKYVPVAERAQYIRKNVALEGATYVATDYSKFESGFSDSVMFALEREIFRYMTQHLATHSHFMRHFDEAVLGENEIEFAAFKAHVIAKRMSGEMFTSLGNGITNLILTMFTFEMAGHDFRELRGVFEGDDGLYVAPSGWRPNATVVNGLGFDLKMQVIEDWNLASFCGNLCDKWDNITVTDPVYVLSTNPFHDRKYAGARSSTLMSITRAKALSIAHQYPGHPILQAYAHMNLRRTRGISLKKFFDSDESLWLKIKVGQAMDALDLKMSFGNSSIPMRPVLDSTRAFIENQFGITVGCQRRMEAIFGGLAIGKTTFAIFDPVFSVHIPDDFALYAAHYLEPIDRASLVVPASHFLTEMLAVDVNHPRREEVQRLLEIVLEPTNPIHSSLL